MKITGSIYRGEGWNAIALYNHFDDVFRKPFEIDDKEHVAHVTYGFDNIKRSLDVYLVKEIDASNLNIKRTINASEADSSVDKRNNIGYLFKERIKGSKFENELVSIIRNDVKNFCQNPAKDNETTISYDEKIVPITKVNYINPSKLLEDGKKEFVPACILRANLDFSRGCIAGFIPEEPYSFDGKTFENFFLDISSECEYCYAIYHHKTFPKSMIEIDKKQLKEELLNWFDEKNNITRKVDVLRLGKRTETGSVYTRNALITTLETCLDTGTQIVMPTKFLEFDPTVAELFKKTGSVILYSIGFEEVERGPVRMGFSDEFKLEQSVKYHDAGVKSGIYLSIDATEDPTENPTVPINEKELRIIEFSEKNNVPIQFLPIRIYSKALSRKMLGKTWTSMKKDRDQPHMFEEMAEGGYSMIGNSLSAEFVHSFWKEKIKNNNEFYRMCHHNSENTYCGTCFIRGGSVTFTPEVNIDYTHKRKSNTYNKKTDKGQTRMDFKKNEEQ